MKELQFSIEIKAPIERVWATLWEDATFRDWASIIEEGSWMISRSLFLLELNQNSFICRNRNNYLCNNS